MEKGKCFSNVHDMISKEHSKSEIFFSYKAIIKFHEIYKQLWVFLFAYSWKA